MNHYPNEKYTSVDNYFLTYCGIPALNNCSYNIKKVNCLDCLKEMSKENKIKGARNRYVELTYNKDFANLINEV